MDLRGTPCPLNFIRTQLALEKLASGEQLEVLLDAGEPDALVCAALQGDGRPRPWCSRCSGSNRAMARCGC